MTITLRDERPVEQWRWEGAIEDRKFFRSNDRFALDCPKLAAGQNVFLNRLCLTTTVLSAPETTWRCVTSKSRGHLIFTLFPFSNSVGKNKTSISLVPMYSLYTLEFRIFLLLLFQVEVPHLTRAFKNRDFTYTVRVFNTHIFFGLSMYLF